VDTADGASLQLVHKLCYLDDMLSVEGDGDAAVKATVRKDRINLGNCCLCLQIRTFPFL